MQLVLAKAATENLERRSAQLRVDSAVQSSSLDQPLLKSLWLRCLTAGKRPDFTLILNRVTSFVSSSEGAAAPGIEDAFEAKAEAGLFRDSLTRQLVCYCCGQNASTGGTHLASQSCAYHRLMCLLLSENEIQPSASFEQERIRATHSLLALTACIGQTIGGAVESFGYTRKLVEFVIARCHFLQAQMPRRPGDLIEQVLACQDAFGETALETILSAVDIRLELQDPTLTSATTHQSAEPIAHQTPQERPLVATLAFPATLGTSVDPAEPASDRCVICRSAARDRVVLPCAHFNACQRCLSTVRQCPVCRSNILATLTAYIC